MQTDLRNQIVMEVEVCVYFDVGLTGDLRYIRYLYNNERRSLRLAWTIFFFPVRFRQLQSPGMSEHL